MKQSRSGSPLEPWAALAETFRKALATRLRGRVLDAYGGAGRPLCEKAGTLFLSDFRLAGMAAKGVGAAIRIGGAAKRTPLRSKGWGGRGVGSRGALPTDMKLGRCVPGAVEDTLRTLSEDVTVRGEKQTGGPAEDL